MSQRTSKSVERKIARLTREIAAIDKDFYFVNADGDRTLYAGMLERKRDDMVRSAVLQLHTAIEDVLTSHIVCHILGVKPEERAGKARTTHARALRRLLFGAGSLGFDMKLNLAVALGVISSQTRKRLMELNTLRNRCSHNWLLKVPTRHGRRPTQKKPPLLTFRGRNLHDVTVLKDFTGEYGGIYVRMFLKYLG
jgi:hypothetical protein